MLSKISQVPLLVKSQDDALKFYKKLGFVVRTDNKTEKKRSLTLNLPGNKDIELALIHAETADELLLVGKQSFSIESTEFQKDYEVMKTLGIKITEQPMIQSWGMSMGFEDLYGNGIHVCQKTRR